jgi:hypothetical protein
MIKKDRKPKKRTLKHPKLKRMSIDKLTKRIAEEEEKGCKESVLWGQLTTRLLDVTCLNRGIRHSVVDKS